MPSEKHLEWIRSGPLWVWRAAEEITQSEAAHRMDVTLMTWQLWERGQGSPNGANLETLIDKTGLEDLQDEFEEWRTRGLEG